MSRGRARANADTMAVGPRGPTSADLEISPLQDSRRAFTCARLSDGLSGDSRTNKKFRSYPWVPAVFSPTKEPSYGAATRQVRARKDRASPFLTDDREI